MTKTKAADPVVTGSGFTIDVTVNGRTYVLRAPSFGEYGQFMADAVTRAVPSDAIFAETLRQVVKRAGGDGAEAALAAIDAHEDGRDHLDSLFAAHGPDRTAWDADTRQEIAAAQRALLAATRARDKVEWEHRAARELLALRSHQLDAQQAERVGLVALCVVSVDGVLTTLDTAAVQAMPAQAVLTIADRAAALLRPTPAAEKN